MRKSRIVPNFLGRLGAKDAPRPFAWRANRRRPVRWFKLIPRGGPDARRQVWGRSPGIAQRRSVITALSALHIGIIIASNYLVQWPFMLFGLHTTWGAFSFPLIYVVTDLTARLLGPHAARGVVARVMLPALLASYVVSVLFHNGAFAGWGALAVFNLFVFRIALGSFIAYAVGQWLDILVFSRLRQSLAGRRAWWIAPATATVLGNLVDTALFSPSRSKPAATHSWPRTGPKSPRSTTPPSSSSACSASCHCTAFYSLR